MQGNLIGTDETGKAPLGNKLDGILITEGSGITIGGTGPGQGNVIAFNDQFGIGVVDGQQNPSTHNSIFGNVDVGISVGGSDQSRLRRS